MRVVQIILLFVFTITFASAQQEIKFHTLSPKGGLSYDGIVDIKQDAEGFMWVMLQKNLFRFDGYDFRTYSIESKSGSTSYNNMASDTYGNIYVSTQEGVYKFSSAYNRFDKVPESSSGHIYFDRKNNLWQFTPKGITINIVDNKQINPEFDNNKLPLNRRLICENDKNLFVFSNYGHIYSYDYKTNLLKTFLNINKQFDNASIAGAGIHNNYLWIITTKFKLFKIDTTTGEVVFQHQIVTDTDQSVRTMNVTKDGNIWFGSIAGLYIFNTETLKTTLHTHSQQNMFSIPNNSVWIIYNDNQQNIWIGTYMGSLAYVNHHDINIFETYHLSSEGLNKVPVSSFCNDYNNIYIATEGGGINILNKATGKFSYLIHNEAKESLSSNNTKAMVYDKDGNLWISTYRGGLNCYNTATKKLTHFTNTPGASATLHSDNIRKIIPAADSGLWIAYQQQDAVFSFFSFPTRKFNHYTIKTRDNSAPQGYIFDLTTDFNGTLWLLKDDRLYGFNPHNKTFEEYTIPFTKQLTASALCIENNNLWIGSFGDEFVKFDTSSKSFSRFSNLFNNNIIEIYSINHHGSNIWLGTNDGLYRFDSGAGQITVFNEADGCQGNVYYPLSTWKGLDGRLYFGGAAGFTIINPVSQKPNSAGPEIIISDFYIDYESALNDTTESGRSGLNDGKIVLNHKQQNFGFLVSCNNYLNPGKNRFRYRLHGYDDRWHEVSSTSRLIQYAKIPAGTYQFEISAANNDGIWGKQKQITIIRRQAPLLSWPAITIYVLAGLFILYQLVSTYRKRKKLEIKLYKEDLERQKNEAIHRNQLRFFTNVSHDLKTPLTLIMATINKMREEGMKEYYYQILNSNSERLLGMLNDLLDFRKAQGKSMQLKVAQSNLNSFLLTRFNDFAHIAIEEKIDYKISTSDSALDNVPFDKSILEKIILNLLNNAFKYTQQGGRITLEAAGGRATSAFTSSYNIGDSTFNAEKCFSIAIRDNGIGITQSSIDKVFDRFYRVETRDGSQHLGSGIGLALVKELVLLHHGSITIYSKRESGTDLIVTLPFDIDNYRLEELRTTDAEEDKPADTSKIASLNIPSPGDSTETGITEPNGDKTILIAEDNHELRTLIKSSLSENYRIVDFENGQLALDYLKDNDVDMIISDIMMPELDGIALCTSVKSNVETSHIPVILLTAKTGVESKIEGGEAGADLYFEKPINFSLLKLSISNIFKQRETLREHYSKNYFADVTELASNKEDTKFLGEIVKIIEDHINDQQLDVNFIAQKMSMSRTKLYSKVKALTGKSVIEFILANRLRHAARLLIEQDISIQEAMFEVGIESQSYFTTAFKKEFGMPPSKFVAQHKEKGS